VNVFEAVPTPPGDLYTGELFFSGDFENQPEGNFYYSLVQSSGNKQTEVKLFLYKSI
jgi:hypothetical protein